MKINNRPFQASTVSRRKLLQGAAALAAAGVTAGLNIPSANAAQAKSQPKTTVPSSLSITVDDCNVYRLLAVWMFFTVNPYHLNGLSDKQLADAVKLTPDDVKKMRDLYQQNSIAFKKVSDLFQNFALHVAGYSPGSTGCPGFASVFTNVHTLEKRPCITAGAAKSNSSHKK